MPSRRSFRYTTALVCAVGCVLALPSLATTAIADAGTTARHSSPKLVYCVPSEDINLNPFEELGEPTRLLYLLLLTRSYISTDPAELGILSKWQFSSDGLLLSAKVSPDVKWADGTAITNKDAAYSLARAIRFRPVGQKVWVKGTESISQPGWEGRSYSGITLIGADEFQIQFESKVANTAGVLREVLSTNARHNRIWAARIGNIESGHQVEIATKFPYDTRSGELTLAALTSKVRLVPAAKSDECDFRAYSVPKNLSNDYSRSESHGQQALLGVINPQGRLANRDLRMQVALWLRKAFAANASQGFQIFKSHFGRLEAGHIEATNWGLAEKAPPITKLNVVKGTNYPPSSPIQQTLEGLLNRAHIPGIISGYVDGAKPLEDELRIAGSRIEGDRQIWVQDWTNDDFFRDILEKYPRTSLALKEIVRKSSATIPTDQLTLTALEQAAFDEASVIPVARYRVNVFSRLSAPIFLVFTDKDELTFKER